MLFGKNGSKKNGVVVYLIVSFIRLEDKLSSG